MANPLLNDKAFNEASKAGWGAPSPQQPTYGSSTPITGIPAGDDPVSRWHGGTMTVSGTMTATAVLFILLLAAAAVGWSVGPSAQGEVRQFPALALVGVFVGLGCVIACHFRPMWAKFLGPVYALAEGFFVGTISRAYETYYDGVVIQAVGATVAVFGVMLFLYRSRILKVTDRMRRIVIAATMGLMLFYLASFVINLIGGSGTVSFLSSSSGLGIAFSVFAAGLAAFNLALHFDFIEKAAERGAPKGMEWYAALGLLVTIVWLYLELLRLLAKLQRR